MHVFHYFNAIPFLFTVDPTSSKNNIRGYDVVILNALSIYFSSSNNGEKYAIVQFVFFILSRRFISIAIIIIIYYWKCL